MDNTNNPVPVVTSPVPETPIQKIEEGSMKYLPYVVAIVVLILLSSWLGWSYKKVVKERDELKNQIVSMTADTHSVTILEPVEVAGKERVKTIIVHDTHNQSVTEVQTEVKTKTVTVEKKSNAWIGAGLNLCNPQQVKLQLGYMVLPFAGVEVEPFFELPFKNPGCFISLVFRP